MNHFLLSSPSVARFLAYTRERKHQQHEQSPHPMLPTPFIITMHLHHLQFTSPLPQSAAHDPHTDTDTRIDTHRMISPNSLTRLTRYQQKDKKTHNIDECTLTWACTITFTITITELQCCPTPFLMHQSIHPSCLESSTSGRGSNTARHEYTCLVPASRRNATVAFNICHQRRTKQLGFSIFLALSHLSHHLQLSAQLSFSRSGSTPEDTSNRLKCQASKKHQPKHHVRSHRVIMNKPH